jgi:hypothetical protein
LVSREAYANIVFKLDTSGRVQTYVLQGCPDNIVGLALALLGGLDGGGLVDVALVVDVELAKSIRQAEDVALLELGVFPRLVSGQAQRRTTHVYVPL